ncbi:MAG: hypothetical protein JW936_00485 [Sedimentisphaerales bacterium]|nr:hypothetical protein [Sedimentisphaerales bacterium]
MKSCLEDLSKRIDEADEVRRRGSWIDFLDDKVEEGYWIPAARTACEAKVDWPKVSVNAALEDYEAMLLQQFGLCSEVLATGGDSQLNVRCNYGVVIIPSLFGCELFMMDEKLDTLPGNHPLGSIDELRKVVDAGVPDLTGGFGGKVFEAAERFMEVLEAYPVLGRNVAVYHPDLQGPIDNAETIWGSEIFYAFYDEPDLVRDFLGLITDTYIAFMRKWYDLVGLGGEYSHHWGLMHKGRIALRNDSLMNLSPGVYVDFIRPLDQRIFDEFGGGMVHYCGKGDHFVPAMSEMAGLTAINLSQPEMNDMEIIYANTVDKGLKLLALKPKVAENAKRPLRGRVHCMDL